MIELTVYELVVLFIMIIIASAAIVLANPHLIHGLADPIERSAACHHGVP